RANAAADHYPDRRLRPDRTGLLGVEAATRAEARAPAALPDRRRARPAVRSGAAALGFADTHEDRGRGAVDPVQPLQPRPAALRQGPRGRAPGGWRGRRAERHPGRYHGVRRHPADDLVHCARMAEGRAARDLPADRRLDLPWHRTPARRHRVGDGRYDAAFPDRPAGTAGRQLAGPAALRQTRLSGLSQDRAGAALALGPGAGGAARSALAASPSAISAIGGSHGRHRPVGISTPAPFTSGPVSTPSLWR